MWILEDGARVLSKRVFGSAQQRRAIVRKSSKAAVAESNPKANGKTKAKTKAKAKGKTKANERDIRRHPLACIGEAMYAMHATWVAVEVWAAFRPQSRRRIVAQHHDRSCGAASHADAAQVSTDGNQRKIDRYFHNGVA